MSRGGGLFPTWALEGRFTLRIGAILFVGRIRNVWAEHGPSAYFRFAAELRDRSCVWGFIRSADATVLLLTRKLVRNLPGFPEVLCLTNVCRLIAQ